MNTYLMRDSRSDKYYKIGKSIDVAQREKTLAAETPTIKLILSIPFDVEKALHKKFTSKRKRGEWFDLGKKEVLFINGLSKMGIKEAYNELGLDYVQYLEDKLKEKENVKAKEKTAAEQEKELITKIINDSVFTELILFEQRCSAERITLLEKVITKAHSTYLKEVVELRRKLVKSEEDKEQILLDYISELEKSKNKTSTQT